MEKTREDFETWATEKDLDLSHFIDDEKMGDYCDVVTQYVWLGWQASRSTLCVELPKPRECDGPMILIFDVEEVLDDVGISHT
ncbi:hypothetical protein KLEA5_gp56 [Aeromonas phage vB_AveS_KLEA5]|nr:hypothetical protein KLEA5_gp56 [Aeromonas phage vB_AveS_KLEA5]